MGSMTEFESEQPPVLKPAAATPTSSLLARLLNIFAIPGTVFEEVQFSRHKWSNWLLPMLLSCMLFAAWGCVLLATPVVRTGITKLPESVSEAVAKGRVSQAEADQLLKIVDLMEKQPEILRVLFVGCGVAIGLLRLAWWAFVLWVLARAFLHMRIPFSKTMEVAGLASMVTILNIVVLLVLTIKPKGGPEGGLMVLNPPLVDASPLVTVLLTLMQFWFLAVLTTGLARLTGALWVRAALLVFISWMMADLLRLLLGVGTLG